MRCACSPTAVSLRCELAKLCVQNKLTLIFISLLRNKLQSAALCGSKHCWHWNAADCNFCLRVALVEIVRVTSTCRHHKLPRARRTPNSTLIEISKHFYRSGRRGEADHRHRHRALPNPFSAEDLPISTHVSFSTEACQ